MQFGSRAILWCVGRLFLGPLNFGGDPDEEPATWLTSLLALVFLVCLSALAFWTIRALCQEKI
jgi:hypothetical protein